MTTVASLVVIVEEEEAVESGGRRMVVHGGGDEGEGVGFEGFLKARGGGGCCLSMQGGAEGSSIVRGVKGSGMRGAEYLETRLEGSLSIHFGVGRRQDSADSG